jgi:hypothetical protein
MHDISPSGENGFATPIWLVVDAIPNESGGCVADSVFLVAISAFAVPVFRAKRKCRIKKINGVKNIKIFNILDIWMPMSSSGAGATTALRKWGSHHFLPVIGE